MKFILPFVQLNDCQHGFIKTITACVTSKKTISNFIFYESRVYGAFLDLRTVLNKINHAILKKKLLLLGVPNYCANLLYYMYNNQNVTCHFNNSIFLS